MNETIMRTTQPENGAIALLTVNDGNFPIDGRELHEQLGIATAYKDWFPRMCAYGFEEGVDFNPLKNERVQHEGGRQGKPELTSQRFRTKMFKTPIDGRELHNFVQRREIHVFPKTILVHAGVWFFWGDGL